MERAPTTAGRGAPPQTISQNHHGGIPRTRTTVARPVPPSKSFGQCSPTARLTWDSQAHRDSEPLWSLESSQRLNDSTTGSASEPRPTGGGTAAPLGIREFSVSCFTGDCDCPGCDLFLPLLLLYSHSPFLPHPFSFFRSFFF